jgi:hypothetical protein
MRRAKKLDHQKKFPKYLPIEFFDGARDGSRINLVWKGYWLTLIVNQYSYNEKGFDEELEYYRKQWKAVLEEYNDK